MSANTDLILIGLVALDVVLYVMLIEGYLRQRRMSKIPKVKTVAEAFAFFEKSYRESFPQETDGFTWGEAVAKTRRVIPLKDLEWDKVQRSLKAFEAYRYGRVGREEQIDAYPILKLAVSLRQKMYYS
jgi:hypothetical protein